MGGKLQVCRPDEIEGRQAPARQQEKDKGAGWQVERKEYGQAGQIQDSSLGSDRVAESEEYWAAQEASVIVDGGLDDEVCHARLQGPQKRGKPDENVGMAW